MGKELKFLFPKRVDFLMIRSFALPNDQYLRIISFTNMFFAGRYYRSFTYECKD